jgi:hypothetical protein
MAEPVPSPAREEPAGTGILLALAAALAAGIGGWSSIVADRGSDTWHAAVRQHVKQAAGAVEDIRFVYQEEGPTALQVAEARLLAEELGRAADRAPGLAGELLRLESRARARAARVLEAGSEIATDPRYAVPETGGFDLVRRLNDNRRELPDLLALDPDATQDEGSRLSVEATLLLVCIVPVAAAFLFGALAYGFPWAGRPLVAAGFVFVAVGFAAAVMVGVVV